ncbi:MAG: hypothetical protein F6K47_41085, partial [Symploca sp. SIO2E6]|nr:hypothetical protein [Symploca sp. SIO2E6]
MEKIKQILEANGVNVESADLEAFIKGRGIDPEAMTEDEVMAIAGELIQQINSSKASAMTKSQGKKGSKPASKKRTTRKSRTAKPNAMQQAVNNVNG